MNVDLRSLLRESAVIRMNIGASLSRIAAFGFVMIKGRAGRRVIL